MSDRSSKTNENPLSKKILESNNHQFTLWLGFEDKDGQEDLANDYSTVKVNFLDGRRYWIDIWTLSFLNTAKEYDIREKVNGKGEWIVPPDLFVKELTRECIEATIIDLLNLGLGELDELLNESIFGLNYSEPWIDELDMDFDGNKMEKELFSKIGPMPRFYGQRLHLMAYNTKKLEWAVISEHGEVAVVPHPKENLIEKDISFYRNKKDFWAKRLRYDI